MARSRFSRMASPVFFSTAEREHARFAFSHFSHFLNSPIKVDSVAFYLNNTVRNRPSQFDHPSIVISSCFFSFCESTRDGGAIEYLKEGSGTLWCENSVFSSNAASANGGAIYFEGETFTFKENCFDSCICDNMGQAYNVRCSNREVRSDINETWISACSPEPKNRNGYGTYIQQGATNHYYVNISGARMVRGAATIAAIMCDARVVMFCTFTNNSAYRTIEFMYSLVETDIVMCNFINNTATMMAVIGYSMTTTIKKCFFQHNSKPITSQPAGRPHTITFQECLYDAFGLPSQAHGVVITDCNAIGIYDKSIPISVKKKDPCVVLHKGETAIFEGFSVVVVIVVSLVIIASHAGFIQAERVTQLLKSFAGTTGKQQRRRRIQKGTARLE